MKWVKHDTDANQDAKLQNVLLDYGLEGYGLYWYCIELIAGKVDKENITFELEHDARIIARNTGSTVQKVEEMMKYFVTSGLFENTGGVVTCLKLAKRLDKSMTSNPEMRELISSLKSHDKVMTQSEIVMQDKNRLEEIRLDKTRVELKPLVDKKKTLTTPYKKIHDSYNELIGDDFPKCRSLSVKRKAVIKKFWSFVGKDMDKVDGYFKFFSKHADAHHRGHNDRGWTADIEFICRETTVEKMREKKL